MALLALLFVVGALVAAGCVVVGAGLWVASQCHQKYGTQASSRSTASAASSASRLGMMGFAALYPSHRDRRLGKSAALPDIRPSPAVGQQHPDRPTTGAGVPSFSAGYAALSRRKGDRHARDDR